ncbi:MAG: hypothetical protein ACK6CU_31135 [Deltaproteobacteria bacterium]|jgi:hypothetical protein
MNEAPHAEGARPAPGHLNRPLDTPNDRGWLRLVQVGAALWLAYHVLVPLRYYALPDHDPYDERFAWRMFSAVRVQRCEVEVTETTLGRERRVNLTTILPMPWIALVERNRPAVQRELLAYLCERPTEPSAVVVVSECTEASGERAATVRRAMDCASGAVTEGRGDDAPGEAP